MFNTPIDDLDYNLETSSIAQNRYIEPKNSKLLISESKNIIKFSQYIETLQEQSVFIFNKSTVRNVRIKTNKVDTQGKVELFVLVIKNDYQAEVLIKSSGKIKIGDTLITEIAEIKILNKDASTYTIEFSENVNSLIDRFGTVPLPPYIKDDSSKYKDYINEFSSGGFSVASSTAGLHFTLDMIEQLKFNGHEVIFINLDINLGTFKPIDTEIVENYKIHSEYYRIEESDYKKILTLKQSGYKIVQVGTTVLRTLETVFNTGVYEGMSNLFITPGYKFNIGDYLITNFHAPKSTLLSIVKSIYGDNWKELYEYAQNNNLKFLSFGDAVIFKIDE